MLKNKIRKVLADKEKNNKFLIDALGVNKSTVSRWVANRDEIPSIKNLEKIAKALEVSFFDLIEELPDDT